ncbi:hypothetical protein HRG_013515 [Hirsutella rhossiliensis]
MTKTDSSAVPTTKRLLEYNSKQSYSFVASTRPRRLDLLPLQLLQPLLLRFPLLLLRLLPLRLHLPREPQHRLQRLPRSRPRLRILLRARPRSRQSDRPD